MDSVVGTTTVDLPILSSGDRRRSGRTTSGSHLRQTHDKSAQGSPVDARSGTPHASGDSDPPNRKRTLRQRKDSVSKEDEFDIIKEALKPLTDEERQNWAGWVELESDPSLFGYILRNYGVKDVEISEVFGLDDESIAILPQPVYGLIFLFKYLDDDAGETVDVPKCPQSVWFANQTINNACATIALMNIVMNVPEIDLGDKLKAFKKSTRRLKPPYRGKQLGSDVFIRNIHNSFARRIDILSADLALQNDYEKWMKSKKKPKRKSGAKRSKKKNEEEEPGYHFVAYVPIGDSVWRLDGLQREPENLGSDSNWLNLARNNIVQRILQYDDGSLEYNLMALSKSPLRIVQEEFAQNMQNILAVQEHLSPFSELWETIAESNQELLILNNSAVIYGVSQKMIENATASDHTKSKLSIAGIEPSTLVEFYRGLTVEHRRLLKAMADETTRISRDDEQAAQRKVDFAPRIYEAVKILSENGVLKQVVQDLREGGKDM